MLSHFSSPRKKFLTFSKFDLGEGFHPHPAPNSATGLVSTEIYHDEPCLLGQAEACSVMSLTEAQLSVILQASVLTSL